MKVVQSCVVGTCGVMDPHGTERDVDGGSSSGASTHAPLQSCQPAWTRPWLPVVGARESRVGPAMRVEISGVCDALKTAHGSRVDGAKAMMAKIGTPANMAALHADVRSIFSGKCLMGWYEILLDRVD